jgi:hypothetical protein
MGIFAAHKMTAHERLFHMIKLKLLINNIETNEFFRKHTI